MSDKEKPKNSKQSSNIWGGRFTGTPSDLMRKINEKKVVPSSAFC